MLDLVEVDLEVEEVLGGAGLGEALVETDELGLGLEEAPDLVDDGLELFGVLLVLTHGGGSGNLEILLDEALVESLKTLKSENQC